MYVFNGNMEPGLSGSQGEPGPPGQAGPAGLMGLKGKVHVPPPGFGGCHQSLVLLF